MKTHIVVISILLLFAIQNRPNFYVVSQEIDFNIKESIIVKKYIIVFTSIVINKNLHNIQLLLFQEDETKKIDFFICFGFLLELLIFEIC